MANQEHKGKGDNINIEGDGHFNVIRRYPTLLADIVNELGRNFEQLPDQPELITEFDIQRKIEHNNVVKFKDIIDDQKIYIGKLNSIYHELDSQGSSKKLTIFRKIKSSYLRAKGNFLQQNPNKSEIEIIREKADSLIESVEKELKIIIDKSENIDGPLEVIDLGLEIVLVDAFIRCKILEKPE